MIWFKTNENMFDSKNLFVYAIYMPPTKIFMIKGIFKAFLVYYNGKLNIIQGLCNVAVIGDLNGRVGDELDCIVQDKMNRELIVRIVTILKLRLTEGVNLFNLWLTNMLMMFGDNSGHYTFQTKNGCSVIDYLLLTCDAFSLVK